MSFQRVHDSSPKNSQTSSNHNPFAPRPFPVQQPQRPQTPEELEKQAFEQDKFEAMGLEVKETRGTITPEESEHLTVLQAKMDSFLQRQWDAVKGQPNLLDIAINNYQAAQQNQSVQQIQPSLLPNKPIRANFTHRSSAPLQPQLNTYQPNRVNSTPSPTVSLQAKLTVGQPNDQYEQEADRVAERVMSMSPPSTPNIQRQGQEAWTTNINQKPIASSITPLVRLKPESEEEEAIQAKCDTCEQEEQIQRSACSSASLSPNLLQASSDGTTQAQPSLESRLNATKGGGSPLADGVRNFMEPRFGADFSQVRVHTGSEAVQMNRELGAQAFAHGSDVYFGAGKSPGNNELTAHELTHVVQQTGSLQRNHCFQSQVLRPQISASPDLSIQRLDVPSWQEIRRYAFTSLINGLRSLKSEGIGNLRAWAARQPRENQAIANRIVSAIDAVAEILLRLTLAVSGMIVGFGAGIVQAVIGLIRLAVGIIQGIILFLYGLIDGGRRFNEWANQVAEAISALPEALRSLIDNWLTEFSSASEDMQTVMIGELTGQILALIATFEFTAARAGSVPRIVVSLESAAPRLAIAGGGSQALATAGVAVDVASPVAAGALTGTHAMSVATHERRGGGERRDVQSHERLGGHTGERHIGKSESWLRRRLASDPDLEYASSFRNEAIANRTQGRFVNRFRAEIDAWLRSGEPRFVREIDMGEPIGIVVERDGGRIIQATQARFVLVKDASSQGWHFLTSFPIR